MFKNEQTSKRKKECITENMCCGDIETFEDYVSVTLKLLTLLLVFCMHDKLGRLNVL